MVVPFEMRSAQPRANFQGAWSSCPRYDAGRTPCRSSTCAFSVTPTVGSNAQFLYSSKDVFAFVPPWLGTHATACAWTPLSKIDRTSDNAQREGNRNGRRVRAPYERELSSAMTPIAYRLVSALRTSGLRASRRRLLTRAAALGAGLSLSPALRSVPRAHAAGSTFTLAANWSPNDIDPHSGYDPGSGFVLAGIYENLIRQRPGAGVQLEPWLAESWETSADASTWSFHLRPGVTFQDGSPLTAPAARESFVRQMTLQRAPANVLGRFL
jgi:hypothetical protein